MYTIKQAATRSGVSVPLLRAWERRYRIVEPARTQAGYRLYDDEALERIRTMRRLVDAGWTPSTAAGAILSGETIDLPAEEAAPSASAAERAAAEGPSDPGELIDRFVAAAIAFDADGLERVLDRMFAAGTFESVADTHLLPALVAVGDAWADGRLGVAGEHAASHAALRRLAAAFQAAGRATPPDGAVLIGMPPTARHELGALAFATAARRAGLPVLYLGSDLPVDAWVSTAARTRARAAVIGVLTRGDVGPAVEVASALREAEPGLAILFGGRSADPAGTAFSARAGVDGRPNGAERSPLVLPEPLADAVRTLEDAIDRRPDGQPRPRATSEAAPYAANARCRAAAWSTIGGR